MPDMSEVENALAETAHKVAVFYRKLIAEGLTTFEAADFARSYLNTLVTTSIAIDQTKKPPEPWER